MLDLETHHRHALARELTAAAGVPLRDRYGFAASEQQVQQVLDVVFAFDDDGDASRRIDAGLAMGSDTPIDEAYELGIVRALRPLVDDRRAAEVRREAVADSRPHTRACPFLIHPHGPQCHRTCPTCGGQS